MPFYTVIIYNYLSRNIIVPFSSYPEVFYDLLLLLYTAAAVIILILLIYYFQ